MTARGKVGPPPDPRPAVTRARVLDAARALLHEEGPAAVTPLRIADRCGVARTTIYRHWPDPAALLLETVVEASEPESFTPSGDLETDLRAFLTVLAERLADPAFTSMAATLIERAQHDERARQWVRQLHTRRAETLRQILRSAITAGEIRADVPVESAVALLAGPVVFARLVAQQEPSASLVDDAVDGFLACARPSGRRRRGGRAVNRRRRQRTSPVSE